MSLLEKVSNSPQICGIEISFNANELTSNISGWQPFFNTIFYNNDFAKIYASSSSVDFVEESFESVSGVFYVQKITFRFPVSDKFRSDRISLIIKAKFFKVKLTNGLHLLIGRNDFLQNKKPNVKIKTNHNMCEVEVESKSIFPCGYTPNVSAYGLPTLIPVNLN